MAMTKAELIDRITENLRTGKHERYSACKADVEAVYEEIVRFWTEQLAQGESLRITGLGTFRVIEKMEHECANPRTGERMTVPACKTVKFTATKSLKEALNQ